MKPRKPDWPALMRQITIQTDPKWARELSEALHPECVAVAAHIHHDKLPSPAEAERTLETATIIHDWLLDLLKANQP